MTNIPLTVADLAHEYDAAMDDIRRLSGHSEFSPKRLMAFERALASAEHIVLLTDSGDWRTKARAAKAERDRTMTNAAVHFGKLERKGRDLDKLNEVAARQFHGTEAERLDPLTRAARDADDGGIDRAI